MTSYKTPKLLLFTVRFRLCLLKGDKKPSIFSKLTPIHSSIATPGREATEFKPIRILADTTFVQSDEQRCLSENQVIQLAPTTSYTCQASDVIDSTIISLIINHVIPDAVSILESIIRVSGPETTLFPSFMFDAVRTSCLLSNLALSHEKLIQGWRTCGEAKIPIPLEFFEGKGDGVCFRHFCPFYFSQ